MSIDRSVDRDCRQRVTPDHYKLHRVPGEHLTFIVKKIMIMIYPVLILYKIIYLKAFDHKSRGKR